MFFNFLLQEVGNLYVQKSTGHCPSEFGNQFDIYIGMDYFDLLLQRALYQLLIGEVSCDLVSL